MYNMFNLLHSLVKYTYATFIFSFTPASGRYIGEISKLAPISVKIILSFWQLMGHNQNFNFHPAVIQIYFNNISSINHWLLKPWHFGKFQPLALLCALNYVSCMVKWEISNISLYVWLIGYLSQGILGNFTIGPAVCIKLCLRYGQMGKFLIFLFLFGTLAVKAMAFWEI